MIKYYNVNPCGLHVGDCVIRALSVVLDIPWEQVHYELCELSRRMCDMPSSNRVYYKYLELNGYTQHRINTECPQCKTVEDFCSTHPCGRYVLSTCDYIDATTKIIVIGTHVIPVIDGTAYDTWMSLDEIPLLYFEKKER